MKVWMRAALCAGLLLASAAASAQDIPFSDGQPVTAVDELVVKGPGGPAWWTVSDGDTTVYALATPGPIPADVTWEKRLLEVRVREANVVILPPGFTFGIGGIFSVPGLVINVWRAQREGERMEGRLEPALRTRWVAAREKAGFPEERYGAHPPGMAAMLLLGDVYAKQYPSPPPPSPRPSYGPRVEEVVREVARKERVRVDRAGEYGLGLMNQVLVDLRKPGTDCMVSVLDELDRGLEKDPQIPPDGGASVRAWANGDVRPLLERAALPTVRDRGSLGTIGISIDNKPHAFRTNATCAASMDDFRGLVAGFMTDQVKAIDEAMKRPGHAVAIVRATDLLRKGGVLEQLKAKGYEIGLPNSQKALEAAQGAAAETAAPAP